MDITLDQNMPVHISGSDCKQLQTTGILTFKGETFDMKGKKVCTFNIIGKGYADNRGQCKGASFLTHGQYFEQHVLR